MAAASTTKPLVSAAPGEGVAFIQAKMREDIAADQACISSLAKLGTSPPRRTAQAGCRLYERSAGTWVDAGDWMAVGDLDPNPEVPDRRHRA